MASKYRDRSDAGDILGGSLLNAGFGPEAVILGIPRGGAVVAARVARALGTAAGVVIARKMGAPRQPELGIGAVTADGTEYLDESIARQIGVDARYLETERTAQVEEARRRETEFGGSGLDRAAGATVIVVDDGIATGATAIAALRAVRAAGAARTVLAVPVAHPRAVARLNEEADEIVCPAVDSNLFAVGQYYRDFRQVEDDEVRKVLAETRLQPVSQQEERTFIRRNGVRLALVLRSPPGRGPFPCVVFAHGLGSGKDSPRNLVIAEALADAGIASLLFDLNGHGESTEDTRGHDAFPDDLAAAWDWALHKDEVDRGRMGLSGSSLGAAVALEVVFAGRAAPRLVVLRAPAAEVERLAGLRVPTLIVIGSLDPLTRDYEENLPGDPHCKLAAIAGAGHIFEEPGALEEVKRLTVEWFRRL